MEERAPTPRRWPALLLAIALAILAVLVALDSAQLSNRPFPGFLVWDNGYLVSFHNSNWTGPSQGLPLNGGRIAAVDGVPFAGGRALLERAAALPVGTRIEYEVVTGEGRRSYSVPTMQFGIADYIGTIGVYLWNALICFAIGISALFLRPDHRQGRAFAAAIVLLGLVLALAIDLNTTYRFVSAYLLAEALLPAAIIAFGLLFPIEWIGVKASRWVFSAVLGGGAALGLANAWWFYSDPEFARQITNVVWIAIGSSGIGLTGVFGYALRNASTERQRIQAAIVFTGGVVAFLFGGMGLLSFFLLGWTFSLTWVVGLLFFFPLTVLYAIVRHDLFNAERFIRLTLGYTVATATVATAYAGGVVLLDELISPVAARGPGASFVMLLGLAIGFEPLRNAVQTGVDKYFYRSVVDAGSVLELSSASFASLGDGDAVMSELEQQLGTALRLEWIHVSPTRDSGAEPAIVEPLVYREETLAWILVGPKQSGAPFSTSDRELVRGMGRQCALALRNLESLRELRDAQKDLLRNERLAAIGEFSRAVAHGIRNPLASIRAAAQVAGARSTEAAVEEPLMDVIQEADRLDARIRALLNYSRPFDPALQDIDLGTVMDDVAASLRAQASRHVHAPTVEIHRPDSIRATTDPALLAEVLLELGSNGLRAMDAAGTLSIRLSAEPGTGLRFTVADEGQGIPPGQEERVFEPFFTTHNDGSGLGLPTVRKIVEALGGELELIRTGSSGSIFSVSF